MAAPSSKSRKRAATTPSGRTKEIPLEKPSGIFFGALRLLGFGYLVGEVSQAKECVYDLGPMGASPLPS